MAYVICGLSIGAMFRNRNILLFFGSSINAFKTIMQSNFYSVDSGRMLIGRDYVALLGITCQAFQVSRAAQCKLYFFFGLET